MVLKTYCMACVARVFTMGEGREDISSPVVV